MKMIRAIVRQEKVNDVIKALMDAGFPGMTKFGVFGRGKQRGVRIGEVVYDELPKEMLMVVVPEADADVACEVIVNAARTGAKGAMGDGKIFITPVLESYTISSGTKDSEGEPAEAATAAAAH